MKNNNIKKEVIQQFIENENANENNNDNFLYKKYLKQLNS